MTGRIFAINKRGYGFIMSEEIPFKRIFFHWTALAAGTEFTDLQRKDIVEFETKESPVGGLNAIKVKFIERPEKQMKEAKVEWIKR